MFTLIYESFFPFAFYCKEFKVGDSVNNVHHKRYQDPSEYNIMLVGAQRSMQIHFFVIF